MVQEFQAQIKQNEAEIESLRKEKEKLIAGGQDSVNEMQKQHEDEVKKLIAKNQADIN